ncbi:MAG: cyclic nucleotide-binding domain-containing protein [Verrucomicrobia bacterium]|nr:cyclic nucleotide-binding domain-containing protein [Verrucomicrobiota bacterium]
MAKSPLKVDLGDSQNLEDNHLSVFRTMPVFKGINVSVLNSLLDAGTDRIVLGGNYIFKQDECGSSLIFFYKGLAVESKRSDGTDCLLGYYSGPSILGESSFLESCHRSTSLYANEDCWITEIDNRELEKLAATSPSQFEILYSNLGTELGKKVSNINSRMNHVSRNPFYRDYGVSWYRY